VGCVRAGCRTGNNDGSAAAKQAGDQGDSEQGSEKMHMVISPVMQSVGQSGPRYSLVTPQR
jgi:hypothetical protein